MWVPTTAVTRPSRYQPSATFSLVASAWKSTSTWSTLPASSPSARVDLGERRASGAQEHVAAEVHDPEAHAVALDDAQAVPGLVAQVVVRAQDRVVLVEVAVDLAAVVGVVAERDDVDARGEQLVGDLRRDAEAAGGVLAVDDDERRLRGARAGPAAAPSSVRLPSEPTTSPTNRMVAAASGTAHTLRGHGRGATSRPPRRRPARSADRPRPVRRPALGAARHAAARRARAVRARARRRRRSCCCSSSRASSRSSSTPS